MSNWDQQYRDGQGRYWPNEELVRFLGRTYGPMTQEKGSGLTAVEMGSGVGGNVWALAKWGFFTYGLELSSEAIRLGVAHAKRNGFEHLKDYRHYIAPSVIQLPAKCANVVIDVQTIQHLPEGDARQMYCEIHRVLVPGGVFFQVHWCGSPEAARHIFPAHPELAAGKESSNVETYSSMRQQGFSIMYWELVQKTYGDHLAEWYVMEARKA